ncbi:unnamed protein product [Rangifer tarandus platyrhynchus]|uniref:Uncharacterized protein n=1 Tax=Rangifer tarandus platyrhynchus TaxID=3082113 RepID=A0AC59ZHA5_RANTA
MAHDRLPQPVLPHPPRLQGVSATGLGLALRLPLSACLICAPALLVPNAESAHVDPHGLVFPGLSRQLWEADAEAAV